MTRVTTGCVYIIMSRPDELQQREQQSVGIIAGLRP
jgi:hypothetical protein